MAENNAVYAIRHPDGSVTLYIDEEYAIDRASTRQAGAGRNPARIVRQRQHPTHSQAVAVYLENSHQGTA